MKRQHNLVRANFVRICKAHLFLGILFVAQIIAYDASKLITPDVLMKRWGVTGLLIVVVAVCWYFARLNDKPKYIHRLAFLLIATDLLVASFNVYTQRGMSSRAVMLFILPILVAACLQRKGAIFVTALLAIVTYLVTTVTYFVLNFNEGYKVELYGEIGFYSGLIAVISGICWTLVRSKH